MIFNKILKVGGITLISRVLGLIRDIMMALFLGASSFSDAFFIAFKLPNIFRRLFAEGSLNTVFTPLLASLLRDEGELEAKKFTNEIFTMFFIVLLVVIILIEVFMPHILWVIAPGFNKKSPESFQLAITLTRITLPYLFFISLASLLFAVVNSLKMFSFAASLPLILNVSLIVGLAYSQYSYHPFAAVYYGAWAITIAGLLQLLLIVWYAKRLGWKLNFVKLKHTSQAAKLFFKRLLPVTITAGMYQINIFIDITIASWMASGSITYLYYGDRLTQLPLAIIGIAIGTVITPFIAGHIGTAKAKNNIKINALLYGFSLGLPTALGFIALGKEMITMLFNYGKFNDNSIHQTYIVLVCYAIGIVPNILLKIIISIYYAEKNNNTPFIVNGIMLIVNTVLALSLSYYMGFVGIALATSITSFISCGILFGILLKNQLLTVSLEFIIEIFKGLMLNTLIFIWIIILKHFWLILVGYYNSRLIFSMTLMVFIFIIIIMFMLGWKLANISIYSDIISTLKRKK